MFHFICPVCGARLDRKERTLVCCGCHSYDLSKSGYVNLLQSQQSADKRHGDDKQMATARRRFLDKGYYLPLLNAICGVIDQNLRDYTCIFDAGCGECWYTDRIWQHLSERGVDFDIAGADISKEVLSVGARRNPAIPLAVASVFHLPVADAACDIVLNLFAPCSPGEFARILTDNGLLIRAVTLERHLWELKGRIYDAPYENKPEDPTIEGFTLLESLTIRETIRLPSREDILDLFHMTPYYYKTGAEDQKKLETLTELDTQIAFGVYAYRKNPPLSLGGSAPEPPPTFLISRESFSQPHKRRRK